MAASTHAPFVSQESTWELSFVSLVNTTLSLPASKPRTGPELIRATKAFAHDVPWKSWWCVLSTGLLVAASYVGILFAPGFFLKLGCSVLNGLFVLRFFVIYHDQQHHAILPRSHLAEALMRAFGIFALSPTSIWRSSHAHHHKHNSNLRSAHIGSFPVMTKAQFLKSSKTKRFNYLFSRHPLTIFLGYVTLFLFGMCFNPLRNHPAKHLDCLVALVVHGGISALLVGYFGWPILILAQTIPHLITFGIGSYLFYAQHNFPSVIYSDKGGWAYEKAALESSSYMVTSRVMRWFTANIGYHHIHHLNHKIPFYRLPEVLRALPELQNPRTTSLAPFEILRCLRLKVWDAEARRMTSVSGL